MLAGMAAFSGLARADASGVGGTTGDATVKSRGHGMKFLSEADRKHLAHVRREVLADNPQLKAEKESLRQERRAAKDGGSTSSAADRHALHEKRHEYRKQMEAAMLQADPTIQPVLDQIKAHRHHKGKNAAPASDAAGNP